MQNLHGLGARRIGVTSLPPLGCVPAAITLFGGGSNDCVAKLNADAQGFNRKLTAEVRSLAKQLSNLKIAVFDIYKPVFDLVQKPSDFGNAVPQNPGEREAFFPPPASNVQSSSAQVSSRQGRAAAVREPWRHRCCATPSPRGRAVTPPATCSSTASTRPRRRTRSSPTPSSPKESTSSPEGEDRSSQRKKTSSRRSPRPLPLHPD